MDYAGNNMAPKTIMLHPVILGAFSSISHEVCPSTVWLQFADLTKVDLGGFQILMSKDDL